MKKKLILLAVATPLLAHSASYNVLISKEHNKFEEGKYVPPIQTYCKMEFKDMVGAQRYGAALGAMKLYTEDGEYDTGDIVSKIDRHNTVLENVTIHATNTYPNSNYYQPEYAFERYKLNDVDHNYWMANTSVSTLTFEFQEPVALTSLEYTDWGRSDASFRNYYINFYDCDGRLVKTKHVPDRLATYHREMTSFSLEDDFVSP